MRKTFAIIALNVSSGVVTAWAAHAGPDFDRLAGQVMDLYANAQVIALGENHGSKFDSQLRLALVRHPEFPRTVDAVVVEFGNALHQPLLDRYIAGEDVDHDALAKVWRDTDAPAWDSPIYFEFLKAIRAVNRGRDAGEQVRVFAGDVPKDWAGISHGRDLLRWSDRGDFPTHIVDCEILARGRKGLLVYGAGHVFHGRGSSFVPALDEKYPGAVTVLIGTGWPGGSITGSSEPLNPDRVSGVQPVAGTPAADWNLGEAIFGQKAPGYDMPLGEAVDVLVYWGPHEDSIVPADTAYRETPEYQAELARRQRLRQEFVDHVRAHGFEGVHQYDDYTCSQ